MDTSIDSDGSFKIGTNTNGLFYKLSSEDKNGNNNFDSISFLNKNYQNMNTLEAKDKTNDKRDNCVNKFLNKTNVAQTYGMHIKSSTNNKQMYIAGVADNNFIQPTIIAPKATVDKLNWSVNLSANNTSSDQQAITAINDAVASGDLFNAKLTQASSPDDVNNFSVFNDRSDYTPVGINGNGSV